MNMHIKSILRSCQFCNVFMDWIIGFIRKDTVGTSRSITNYWKYYWQNWNYWYKNGSL